MKSDNIIVNVNLWGTRIGKLSWDKAKHLNLPFSANTWENSSAHIHCMGVMGKRSSLTINDFIEFAEDFVENPEDKIRKVFRAVEHFIPLCDKYGVDKNVAEKIQSVLASLVVS